MLVLNKVDAAAPGAVQIAEAGLRAVNPTAPIVRAASPVVLDDPAAVQGRRVLVIEDGPSITHGGMAYGAGYVASSAAGAAEIIDPRAAAAPELRQVFRAFPHIGRVLPALGYGPAQLRALETTINDADADLVVSATPVDLGRLLRLNKKLVRARYDLREIGEPSLSSIVDGFLDRAKGMRSS